MLTINDGTLATFLAESFPTEVRYTGFALSFNTANALLGGTAPTIATALIQYTGSSLAPAYYLAFIAFLALTAMLAIHSTRQVLSIVSKRKAPSLRGNRKIELGTFARCCDGKGSEFFFSPISICERKR